MRTHDWVELEVSIIMNILLLYLRNRVGKFFLLISPSLGTHKVCMFMCLSLCMHLHMYMWSCKCMLHVCVCVYSVQVCGCACMGR